MQKLFTPDIAGQIQTILKDMVDPITIVYFADQSCQTCQETLGLLEETAALSDKISLVTRRYPEDAADIEKYDIQRVPSFVFLDKAGQYKGVKFNGIPAGHEINSFLAAIIGMSGADLQIPPEYAERMRKIDKPVDIKVFVTLSCPHCPGAVQVAHLLAMQNPNIKAEMIESQTFSDMARKYNVSGVPKIVINETNELLGDQPVESYLQVIESL